MDFSGLEKIDPKVIEELRKELYSKGQNQELEYNYKEPQSLEKYLEENKEIYFQVKKYFDEKDEILWKFKKERQLFVQESNKKLTNNNNEESIESGYDKYKSELLEMDKYFHSYWIDWNKDKLKSLLFLNQKFPKEPNLLDEIIRIGRFI